MSRPVTCRCGTCRKCKRRARYAPTGEWLERRAAYLREWRKDNPGDRRKTPQVRDKTKKRAWNSVAAGVRRGTLERQPCEACGSLDVQAHHEDYTKPRDVMWLCRRHHLELHGKVAS